MITLRVDDAAVLEGLAVLGDQAPVAAARAINRTVQNVVTAMARVIAQSLRAKSGDVKKRITSTSATRTSLTARVSADNKPLPVIAFNARGPEPSRGKGRGVSATTRVGRYPHAFIATMRSGHRGVFQRVGTPRLKIRELKEASVAAVWMHNEAVGQARGNEQLTKNLQHAVDYLLTKQVQKALRRSAQE